MKLTLNKKISRCSDKFAVLAAYSLGFEFGSMI